MITPPVMTCHPIRYCGCFAKSLRGRTYRSVVHVVRRDGQVVWQGEDDADEERPDDAVDVRRPAEEAVAHVERTWLEVHLGVVPERPSPAVHENLDRQR